MAVACLLCLSLPSVQHRESLVHTEVLAEGAIEAKSTVTEKPHGAVCLKNNNLVFGLGEQLLRGN